MILIDRRQKFDLTSHLARSAEVTSWDLTAHLRTRQPIEVVRTTCALLRSREGRDGR